MIIFTESYRELGIHIEQGYHFWCDAEFTPDIVVRLNSWGQVSTAIIPGVGMVASHNPFLMSILPNDTIYDWSYMSEQINEYVASEERRRGRIKEEQIDAELKEALPERPRQIRRRV